MDEFTVVLPFSQKTIDSNEQDTENSNTIIAATQATITQINVCLGKNVCIGDTIVVLTAMKMEVSKTNVLLNHLLCCKTLLLKS